MNTVDEELAIYRKIVTDREEEQRKLHEARVKIVELEQRKKEEEQARAQAEKVAKERAIHDKVDKTYSKIYVKHGNDFLEVDKYWFTADRQLIGCAMNSKNGTYKFFRMEDSFNSDSVFVEKYRPKIS